MWASLAKPPEKPWGWSQGVRLLLGVGKKCTLRKWQKNIRMYKKSRL